MATPSPSPGG